MDENSIYLDSIHISQSHVDTILSALIAVYNTTGLAARDTVVDIYGIHSQNYPTVDMLYVQADTALPWMDSLNNGVIPTGNVYIDSLISSHYLNLTGYSEFGNFFNYHIASFVSDSSYNLFALGSAFMESPMVFGSGLNALVLDGGDITCNINSDHVELTYSIGWGDCMSGCIYERFWVFKVYFDCSVEYVGSYGDVIYYMDVDHESEEKLHLYPNPATTSISLSGITENSEILMTDLHGKIIFRTITSDRNLTLDVSIFERGIYIVRVNSSRGTVVKRIVLQ
jgi:hypothetical protein